MTMLGRSAKQSRRAAVTSMPSRCDHEPCTAISAAAAAGPAMRAVTDTAWCGTVVPAGCAGMRRPFLTSAGRCISGRTWTRAASGNERRGTEEREGIAVRGSAGAQKPVHGTRPGTTGQKDTTTPHDVTHLADSGALPGSGAAGDDGRATVSTPTVAAFAWYAGSPGRGRAVLAGSVAPAGYSQAVVSWSSTSRRYGSRRGPRRARERARQAKHLPCPDSVRADYARAGDGLGHVGDGAVAPPPDLEPEQRRTSEEPGTDRAYADDSAIRTAAAQHRGHLDDETLRAQAYLKRGVVQVARSPMPVTCLQGFEDPPVEADAVAAGAERQPVQRHAGGQRCLVAHHSRRDLGAPRLQHHQRSATSRRARSPRAHHGRASAAASPPMIWFGLVGEVR